MKIVKIILSPEAEEVYKYLNEHAAHSKSEQTFLNAIKKKVELIRTNPHYGDSVPKRLIPKEYRVKYDITNLFRVELPGHWRMLYTLAAGESQIEIIAFVLHIIDHKTYDRKFGYN